MLKKIILAVICALMGGVFVFSAYTKLYPVEPFEFTFVELGLSWQMAPFIARFLIGFELLIGVLLILNIQLKKITYKLGIITLLIFCIYLLLQIVIAGNTGNCGCFGTTIQMTPLQALLKNIGMLIVFLGLYKLHDGWNYGKASKFIIIGLFLTSLILPFILNPVKLDYSEAYLSAPEKNFKIPLDTLYDNALVNTPPQELRKGKYIISFMSLTCKHCRIAAKKIHIINQKNPNIPFYCVLNGKPEDLKGFFDDTQISNLPYCMLKGSHFIYLAGLSWPAIYLMNNSVVENKVNYIILDQTEIEKWLDKPTLLPL
ncbi:MAG: MauE/DoxX family redox-associated membrane protein [Bacteroidia bacterium]